MKKPILLALWLCCLSYYILNAQAQESYEWSQVRIGGGGYITGMKIHPNNSEIAYFRTDVGGIYRWDEGNRQMVQLFNFPFAKKNYYGVAGIALHPTKENIVYAAVDRGNTSRTSKILYSENYGSDWTEIAVAEGIKFGANGGREGTGFDDKDREGAPIVINPKNSDELWVGTRENGLWILDLTKNQKWRKVDGIPDNTKEASIRTIQFHPKDANFIYVAYAQFGIYRSMDGGSSFQLINNGIDDLKEVADISLSKDGRKLYAAVRNKGIYKLTYPARTFSWKKLNLPFANLTKGYQTVTASLHEEDVVIASPAAAGGNNLARLQVSKDAGETWESKSNTDITSLFGWRSTDNAGAYTSQIAFDPSDPKKLYLSCWFGLWHTDNWDAERVIWGNDRARGHEEIVPTGLVAFPQNKWSKNVLAVNSADSPAIIIADTDSYENTDIKSLIDDPSLIVKGQDIAVCEAYPGNFIISATDEWAPTPQKPSSGSLFYTKDGGKEYFRIDSYKKEWGKALVATSVKDPDNIVVVHGNQIHYSRDRGMNFSKAEIPSLGNVVENNVFMAHDPLAGDLVLNQVFYLYDRFDGAVYVSRNAGKKWVKTINSLPVDSDKWTKASLKSAPGNGGHLWFNHPTQGLYRSSDQGDTWSRLEAVKRVKSLALGKAVGPGAYPAIYIIGVLTGESEEAIYRSNDEGTSWTKISDASTQFLLSGPRYLAADRTEFGKVYVGISGLGVWQGSLTGANAEEVPLVLAEEPFDGAAINDIEEVGLYPIPSNTVIHIDFKDGLSEENQWEVYDFQGRKLREGNSGEIDVEGLVSGIYIVSIRSGKTVTRKRVVIE